MQLVPVIGITALAVAGGLLLFNVSHKQEAPSMNLVHQAETKLKEGNADEAACMSRAAADMSETEEHSDLERMKYQQNLVRALATNADYEEAAVAARKAAMYAEKIHLFADVETYGLSAASYEISDGNKEQALKDYDDTVAAEIRLVGADSRLLVPALTQAGQLAGKTSLVVSKKYFENIDRILKLDKTNAGSYFERLKNAMWLAPTYTRLNHDKDALALIDDVTEPSRLNIKFAQRDRSLIAKLESIRKKIMVRMEGTSGVVPKSVSSESK